MILLIGFASLSLILAYQNALAQKEYTKEEYRILTFTINTYDISFLKDYDIEDYEYIEDKRIAILFSTYDERNRFIDECNKISDIMTEAVPVSNAETTTLIFKTIFFIITLTILILIFIFILNHILNLRKDMALYKILGFKKYKVLCLLGFFYNIIYIFLYLISYNCVYAIYYILGTFNIISEYYTFYKLNWKFIIIISFILISALILSNKENKRISDLDILKID